MTFVITLLNALAAIPSIFKYVDEFASAVVTWYMSYQKTETLSEIADAADAQARAVTDQDRYLAADLWAKALKRDRYIP